MIKCVGCGIGAAFLLLGAQHVHGGLAWLVGVPIALAAHDARRFGAAVAMGLSLTLVGAIVGEMSWVAATGEGYFGLSSSVAWPAAVAVVVTHSLMVGPILGVGIHAAARGGSYAFILGVAATWVVWEELLLWVIPNYPWVSLAATQLEHLALVQAVAFVGQRGLAAAVLATGLGLGLALREHRLRPALIALAIPAFLAAVGSGRLGATAMPRPSACRVSSLDAMITAPPPAAEQVWKRYAEATRAAAKEMKDVDVVVWPESALPGDPTTASEWRRALEELVATVGAPLITGGRRQAWGADWQPLVFNSAFLARPGVAPESYDKRRLVPLAERWPAPLLWRPSAWPVEETAPGDHDVVWPIGDCDLGVLICFEADDPWRAATLRGRGARALVVLTNDAQLPAAVAAVESRQARLRALETGLPVLRAANRGISVAVDPYGRVRASSDGGWLHQTVDEPCFAPGVWVAPWIVGLAGGVVLVLSGIAAGTSSRWALSRSNPRRGAAACGGTT